MLDEHFPMEEAKTAHGLCRFTEDSLVLEGRLYHFLSRYFEYNKKLGGVLLLTLGMMAYGFFGANQLTIAYLLSFLGILGWLVLFAVVIILLLRVVGRFFKRDRLPSNLVRSRNIEIPLESITQVAIKDLPDPNQTISVGYRESDSQVTAMIRFYPGMNEQFESTVALFEEREFQVEE